MNFYFKGSSSLKDYNFYLVQNIIVEASLLRYFIIDERLDKFNQVERKAFKGKRIKTGLGLPSEDDGCCDVLIVHQGIIDEEGYTDKKFLSLKDKFPFFIITSGRGVPANLSAVGKFLPFSVLETYLMKEYPEKILFNLLLMRLQRRF
jgi:hypothetical protein